MNYGVPVDLLRFLGACVYGDAAAYYHALDQSARDALEREGCAFGQQAWLYRFLYDELPEERRAKYRKVYQFRQAQAAQGAHAIRQCFDEQRARTPVRTGQGRRSHLAGLSRCGLAPRQ